MDKEPHILQKGGTSNRWRSSPVSPKWGTPNGWRNSPTPPKNGTPNWERSSSAPKKTPPKGCSAEVTTPLQPPHSFSQPEAPPPLSSLSPKGFFFWGGGEWAEGRGEELKKKIHEMRQSQGDLGRGLACSRGAAAQPPPVAVFQPGYRQGERCLCRSAACTARLSQG